jgi:glycosyltransferase involved in cell wall biosynthesis
MYRSATVFATMSEHEGFCVPLLEAMGFAVPVLARNVAAIPETMGDAGLLLPEDAKPELIAEAMAELITSQPLRDDLVKKGQHRVGGFDPDIARAEILNGILRVAASS